RPLADDATGICRRSASARRSAAAPPYLTPCPIRITGRSAASSMSTAFVTPSGSAPHRHEMLAFHSSGFGVSSAAASLNTRNGTESRNELASAIGRLAEPGPHDVKVAVGWPDTR